MRICFLTMAVLIAAAPARADVLFHNGGTGACTGCHTAPPELIGSDAGSTCLLCHQAPLGVQLPSGSYVATDARTSVLCMQLPPGGDFCWLKKTYTWQASQAAEQEVSLGERHGHNIVAIDFAFQADTMLQTAPGGTYPSSGLSCIGCHDPHGTYRRTASGTIATTGVPIISSGSYDSSPDPSATGAVGTYRLLAGKGYKPKSLPAVQAFTADPPAAVAPSTFNRSEAVSDTRVAYGSGMSEWCQNCHVAIHNDATVSANRHPAGNDARLPMDVTANYNFYLFTGNLGGNLGTAYTSLVPFEMGTKDYTVLKRTASSSTADRSGPQAGANVMCLSCHRAHASGWDSIARWNMNAEFLVYEGLYPGIDNYTPAGLSQGRLSAETRKTFYDRPATVYSPYQRSLCNKCHVKD